MRRRASAARAGGHLRREAAQAEGLEDLLGDPDLLGAITAGAGRERHADRVADARLQQDREPGGGCDDALGTHSRLGEAEVQGVVAAGGEHPVDVHQVLHPGDFGGEDDAVVRESGLFREGGRPECAFDHGVHGDGAGVARLRQTGVGVHHGGEQLLIEAAPIDADAHRLAVGDGDLDNGAEVVVAAAGAHVAGIDAVLGQRRRTRRVFGQQQVAVVMEVTDHGDVHLRHDVGDGAGRRVVVDRNPHQLRAGGVEGPRLRHRGVHVRGVGVGHRLHDDRMVGADPDAGDVDGGGGAAGDGHASKANISPLPSPRGEGRRERAQFSGRSARA